MKVKICNFLSTLFRNNDFISQKSPILADVKNVIFFIINEMSIVVDLIEKSLFSLF